MDDFDWFTDLDAVGVAAEIRSRRTSPIETVDAALGKISALNDRLNACWIVLDEQARIDAREAERTLASGERVGPLCGVPVVIKDVIWVQGVPATMGSRALADFVPPVDSAAVHRLRAAGAIIVAKSTNPEFLWRGYSADSLHGVTRNPWSPDRTPGATSGGSAAAVSSGMVPLALGTDAAGSIRGPAAYCGVMGHKPSHGLVPRTPGFEEMRTTNVVGPIARSVRDLELALRVMAGPDQSDDLCLRAGAVDLERVATQADVEGLRVGWAPEIHGAEETDPTVREVLAAAAEQLTAAGLRLEPIRPSVPGLTTVAFQTWLGELPDRPEMRADQLSGFGRLLFAESRQLSARDYYLAQLERARITAAWNEELADYDVVLTPTAPSVAPPFGPDRVRPEDGGTVGPVAIANLTGRPALSLPVGVTAENMPVGLDIMGRRGEDATCLAVARAIESTGVTRATWRLIDSGIRSATG